MKPYHLSIAPAVFEQIRQQMLYIAQDSIDNAVAWEDRLHMAIERLAQASGLAVDEDASERLGEQVRKLVFEGIYIVHFRVDETSGIVEVINFRHGARLPQRGEP